MLLLRYLYVLALVAWIGGLVVAGAIVAPATFGVLGAWNAAEGRVLAGQVFGEVLRRVHLGAYVLGGVMVVALSLQRLLGPRPVSFGIRITLIGIMLALMAASGAFVTPRVAAMQAQVSGPIAALPPDDARRVEFNRYHGLANILLSAVALGGLILVYWEARE